MLLQQQQAFFQQFNFQPGNAAAPVGQQFARPIGLPEFSKLAPQFDGKSNDPTDAEFWVTEVEKAFMDVESMSKIRWHWLNTS